MKKNNLHSDVFLRHQGGYSLKKWWSHLMLLGFGHESGLSQSEEDFLIVRAKAQPDSESDPEEGNDNPFHDSENSYSKEHPCYLSDPGLPALIEAARDEADRRYREGYSGSPDDEVTEKIRLLIYKYFPKDDPNALRDREKIKAFFDEASCHLKKNSNGLCGFRHFGGHLRDRDRAREKNREKDRDRAREKNREKDIAIAMIRTRLYKYFPEGGSGATNDPEKKIKFDEEVLYIIESYKNGDFRFIVDAEEKVEEEIRLELNEIEDKYFPKDDPSAQNDKEKLDNYIKEAFHIVESYTEAFSIVERYPKDPSYGGDPQEDDSNYGSDPDDGSDTDDGRDTDGPDYGSDPNGHFYESDPDGHFYESDPDGHFYESDPEDYLQKKRNLGGDYLQIDRYPEDTRFKIERDPEKIDRYIEEPFLDYGSDPQEDDPSYGGDPQEDDPSYGGDPQEDDSDSGSDPNPRKNYTHKYKHLWLMCDECYTLNYRRFLKERLYICEGCGFHLKMNSSERLKLLIDPDTWDPMNEKMASLDPIEFHSEEDPYIDRVNSYQKKTGLTEAIQTGLCQLNGIPTAMGVMEFGFMGGSMGSVVGEKITRLVEYATNQALPLIIVCASGGARMQEGSLSLMQMAKISSSLYDFQTKKKSFYVSILTSPTTGGVTASFGMLGDVIVAEPDAYIAFAGKRVIELTLNKEVPEGSQETEYLFEKGLFDLVIPRKDLKSILKKLFGSHGFFPFTLNQNHSSITEH
uniref:Acetyl-coenzyme A carboxylase carboxyl transferase subunit beta, chloroplastic n=1 Tax=Lonicera acuminata TaxID=566134 RepID=A0A8K1VQ90_9DIPS|nr:acetyl-CoA carboxylase beta subunit [Lonicera acuminata]